MLCLVNGMIDMAQMQLQHLVLVAKRFTLASLEFDLKELFQMQTDHKQIEFDVNVQDNLSVLSDKPRLLNILVFLVSNSFKYTDQGSISVEVN